MKKRILIIMLAVVLALSMTVPSALAAITGTPEYSVSAATKNGDAAYSFQITVRKPAAFDAYSGVAFWIRLPSGATFDSIHYSLSGGVVWSPSEKPEGSGNYNFGYWAASNIFKVDLTCTFFISYAGTAEATVTVTEVGQIIFKEGGGTDELVATPNTQVRLTPGGPIVAPPDTPPPSNPGGNDGGTPGNPGGGGPGLGGDPGGGDVPGGSNPTPIPGADIEGGDTPLGAFPFMDVIESNWFFSDVVYMWANRLMNGVSETLFDPNGTLTRGMVVTVLYRMEGSPDASELEMPFSDVAQGAWYYDAVKWAADNGVVAGYPDGTFRPSNTIYRQDLALILSRYADSAEIELAAIREYAEFADDAKIDAYARDAVEALYESGIINGKSGNNFDPKGSATRAEFAAILHRVLVK